MHTGDSSISIARPAHVSRIRMREGEKLSYPSAMRFTLRGASRGVGDVADHKRIRAGDAFARLSRVGGGEKKMEHDQRAE